MRIRAPEVEPKNRAPGHALETLAALRAQIWQLLKQDFAQPSAALPVQVRALTQDFSDLVRRTPDAVLGSLLLDETASYAQVHPVMVAAICALLSERCGFDEVTRQTTIAAALTCNIGMLTLHEVAATQAGALSPVQQAVAHEHPLKSAALLKTAGVSDPLWLTIVTQHHERPDGTGYPHGLRGQALCRPARLVALADVYTAMVLPRHHRDGIHAQQALREIFLQRGAQIDAALAADFINELGVFPPGIFVRLDNGEIGVVLQRGAQRASQPLVSCFKSPQGSVYPRPVRRDTAEHTAFGIAEVLRRQPLPCSLQSLWKAA
jgi:HD-GYP domain-containing protein (c-di-GMP phosphodiesterase class II)